MRCEENGKPGWKYGESGACYTYTAGNEQSSNEAKRKAHLQGAAIESHTGENANKAEDGNRYDRFIDDGEGLIISDDEPEEAEKAFDIASFLQASIEDEEKGIRDYAEAIQNIDDENLKEAIKGILADEQKHLGILQGLANKEGALQKADYHSRDFLDKLHELMKDLDIDEDTRRVIIARARGYAGGKARARNRIAAAAEEAPQEGQEGDEPVAKTFRSKISKVDEYKHVLTGVVLEPDTVDLQGDVITSDDIYKAMEKYMIKSQTVGKQHNGVANAAVIESYVAPCDFMLGNPAGLVRKGSWVMSVKIFDERLWGSVMKGEFTGFSIGGSGVRTPT
jgi:rubrerythrin